ncbi:MAG TPA: GspH/FimT family pseudopilin [Noviherbaspirillum sp.]|nr:GspH/FimT family pseudopilin [Noviherbaspirillum sp.]
MDSAHSRTAFAHVGARPVHGRFGGFTLTELLIGVAIVSLLASIAAPSFSDLMAAQRTRAGATDLYLALAKARSEAIKRNTNVTLSKKGANWQDGWEILNPTDNTIKLEDHNAVTGITITGPTSVVYLSTGRVRGTTRPSFDFSISGTSAAACVTVDLSGLPTQKSSPC